MWTVVRPVKSGSPRWLLLVASVLLLMFSVGLARADRDHIFCVVEDQAGGTRFFSAIFIGEYIDSWQTKSAFHDFLMQEGNAPNFSSSWCFSEESHSAADREFEQHVDGDEYLYRIVRTNWAPESFTARALQDFHITVPEQRQQVNVCVRDHECEDGDQVRVSVNGQALFSGEIDNAWACDRVSVSAGRNEIELYAINGTGRKGNCSYADENTGELRVEGENAESQLWRHRGWRGFQCGNHCGCTIGAVCRWPNHLRCAGLTPILKLASRGRKNDGHS